MEEEEGGHEEEERVRTPPSESSATTASPPTLFSGSGAQTLRYTGQRTDGTARDGERPRKALMLVLLPAASCFLFPVAAAGCCWLLLAADSC